MKNSHFQIREINESDKNWIVNFITQEWGSDKIYSRGKLYDVDNLKGYVALQNNKYIGLITYRIENNECEIITLNSLQKNIGVGSTLINTLVSEIKENKIKRLWLVTTNNNISAIKFYQKKGFTIKTIYLNEMEKARKIKPQIPLTDKEGTPIKDEIELEYIL